MYKDPEKIKSLLEKFLDRLSVVGTCGFWVDYDDDGKVSVYLILDIDYIKTKGASTKPELLSMAIRQLVRKKIEDYLGLDDIYIGSIVKKCEEIKN